MRGVVYYNAGTKCLARLAVSIHSLRKHWFGEVMILNDYDYGESEAHKHIPCHTKNVRFDTPDIYKRILTNKTRLGEVTPYDTTLFLDADTLVVGDITPMFDAAERSEFASQQFSDWTAATRRIRHRIKNWQGLYRREVRQALKHREYPAINTGIFAWRKDSEFMKDWYKLCLPGSVEKVSRIPDETSAQVFLPRYPHEVLDSGYNHSCKHPAGVEPKIIHYHGNKHCRFEKGKPVYMAEKWYQAFDEIKIPQAWIDADRQLKTNLPRWNEWK